MIVVLNLHRVQEVIPLEWFDSLSEEYPEHSILWPVVIFLSMTMLHPQPFSKSASLLWIDGGEFEKGIGERVWSSTYEDCQWLVFGSILCLVILWNIIFGELQRRQCGEWVRGLIGDSGELIDYQSS